MLAKRETQRYAIAWWNRYFKDLAESEPKRIRARRSIADAKAEKEDLESKLAQLQSINKDEFRQGLTPHSYHAHMIITYALFDGDGDVHMDVCVCIYYISVHIVHWI